DIMPLAKRSLPLLLLILLVYLTSSLGSVGAVEEEYLTEAERIKYSDAVFDGAVEGVAQVGVIDEYQTLWEATVLLKSVVKDKSLTQGSRVKVNFTGPNGQKVIACPSPPRIEPQMKGRFYAKRRDFLEFKKALFIQSGQWLLRKDAI